MDLATRKYNFIQQLFEVDENLFHQLELVLETNKSSKPISIKQYNFELEEADKRIENGDFYSGAEVEKIIGKW